MNGQRAEREGPARQSPKTTPHVPCDASEHAPAYELRQGGVVKVTPRRKAEARCQVCDATFCNVGGAWSHAASSRHPVTVDYASTFVFLPIAGVAR